MNKKTIKIIIISVFLLLIFITAFSAIQGAIESYNYDMDPANGVDILEGVGAAMILGVGGFIVLYEIDLFYTTYYFLIRPKTVRKSILMILANLSLLLIFFTRYLADILRDYVSNVFSEEWIIPIFLFFAYVVLRCVCLIIDAVEKIQTEKKEIYDGNK